MHLLWVRFHRLGYRLANACTSHTFCLRFIRSSKWIGKYLSAFLTYPLNFLQQHLLYWFFDIFFWFYEIVWYVKWDYIWFFLLFMTEQKRKLKHFSCIFWLHKRCSHCCCWSRYQMALVNMHTNTPPPVSAVPARICNSIRKFNATIYIHMQSKCNCVMHEFYKIRKSVHESGWPRCILVYYFLGKMDGKRLLFLWWCWWWAARKTLKTLRCIRKFSEKLKRNRFKLGCTVRIGIHRES